MDDCDQGFKRVCGWGKEQLYGGRKCGSFMQSTSNDGGRATIGIATHALALRRSRSTTQFEHA